MMNLSIISSKEKEGGFILVWALLLMVVVLLLGISGIGTSVYNSVMSANTALHKQSFFQADGGTSVAGMLIEQNVNCPTGFTATTGLTGLSDVTLINSLDPGNNSTGVLVANRSFATTNISQSSATITIPNPPVSDTSYTPSASAWGRDAYYYYDPSDTTGTKSVRTNIKTYAQSIAVAGGSLEMAAGYEGRGKGIPGGGGAVNYETYSEYMNHRNSKSIVEMVWQHMVGFEGTCKY